MFRLTVKYSPVKSYLFKVYSFFIVGLSTWLGTNAQDVDSSHVRISILTCSPGADLYSTFGHSGIRVTDTTTHSDKVYNYGTFDFYDPDFYLKFVRGKLYYYLDVEQYNDFLRGYQYEKRSIVEQELLLTTREKLELLQALKVNAREENKYYRYDFLFDNCATRIRDIVNKNVSGGMQVPVILPEGGMTFRELIYYYLDKNKAYWSKLGIDILLGSGLDRKATDAESMFLPDYLYKGFDSAKVGNRLIVKNRQDLLKSPPLTAGGSLLTPFVVFSVLLVFYVLAFVVFKSNTHIIIKVLDFVLFLLTGLIGVLLVFMWVGTDHQLCRNNLNLLWAIPLHSIAAFSIIRKKQWAKRYWLFSAGFAVLLLLFWTILPQHLNTSLIPVVILLAWRSWVQYQRK